LVRLFNQEESRNAATILSTLPREFASTILKDLDPSRRVEIIRNIASLTKPDEKEIAELKFSLRLRIQKLLKNPEAVKVKSPAAGKAKLPVAGKVKSPVAGKATEFYETWQASPLRLFPRRS